jgi:hypothetical protein
LYGDRTYVDEGMETRRTAWHRWLLIGLGVLALVVLANVAAVTVVAVTPERCQTCHTPSGEGTLQVRESHADVKCRSCHGGVSGVERAEFAARQVYGMYLKAPGLTEGRSTAAVTNASCRSCHDVAGVSDTGAIRINHTTCAADRDCTDCHSRVAHGDSVKWSRSYDMFECVPCHMSQAQSVQCDFCHTARSPEERVRTGTFALTHGPNWRQAHGMGDALACAACHPAEKCVSCHGSGVPHTQAFAKNHSEAAVQPDAQCTSCHQKSFCDSCHGIEMPHPTGFTPAHSKIVKAEGQEKCNRCHAPSDCVNCHVKHVHPGNAALGGGK